MTFSSIPPFVAGIFLSKMLPHPVTLRFRLIKFRRKGRKEGKAGRGGGQAREGEGNRKGCPYGIIYSISSQNKEKKRQIFNFQKPCCHPGNGR